MSGDGWSVHHGAGVTARDAGLALVARFAPDCQHPTIEPVQPRGTDEVVAALCADCLREVPALWFWKRIAVEMATR